MARNNYEILGVSKDADQQEIRKSFRELAKQWHPDANASPEAHQRFAEINQAHETLSDPVKRKLYDLRLQIGDVFSVSVPWPVRKKPTPEEQRRQYWQSEAGQKRKQELEQEAAIFTYIINLLKIIAFISIATGLILIIEKTFATTKGPEVVEKYQAVDEAMQARNFHEAVLVTTTRNQFKMDLYLSQCVGLGDSLSVYKGPVFNMITHIQTVKYCDEASDYEFDPRNGLFEGTFFLVYFIIILALVVLMVSDQYVKGGLGVLNLLFLIVIISLVIQNL